MLRVVLLVILATSCLAVRPSHNAGAPGFLGAAKTRLALLDAVAVNASSPAISGAAAAAVPRAHVATASSSTQQMCAAASKTIFCPAPKDLQGWKEHASCCMGHCGSGREICFDGCIRDCVKVNLDCTGLALQNECSDQCKKLQDCKACVATVKSDGTTECQSKCMVDFAEDVQGEKCKLSR